MYKNQSRKGKVDITSSSGNVYADTGHANPEEAMEKAELAILITETIKRKKLTQKKSGRAYWSSSA